MSHPEQTRKDLMHWCICSVGQRLRRGFAAHATDDASRFQWRTWWWQGSAMCADSSSDSSSDSWSGGAVWLRCRVQEALKHICDGRASGHSLNVNRGIAHYLVGEVCVWDTWISHSVDFSLNHRRSQASPFQARQGPGCQSCRCPRGRGCPIIHTHSQSRSFACVCTVVNSPAR